MKNVVKPLENKQNLGIPSRSENGIIDKAAFDKNHWKNKQITSSGPAVETVLLLHPPAGHRQFCKGILVKPMENKLSSWAQRMQPRVRRCPD